MSSLAVVPTGTANLASVLAAFKRLGVEAIVTSEPKEIERADRVVVPGVGSFGAAMAEIDRLGMRQPLQERLDAGNPTLAICVGMQLLANSSEETAGARGLAHLSSRVSRFPDTVRIPQLGWNRVAADPECVFLSDGWAYFANSYRMEQIPDGWAVAVTDHGGRFAAGLERGDVLACQFHPELSGAWGSGILRAWLGATGRAI